MEVIKVSGNSRSTSVAGAIAGVVREQGHAEVQAIGAGAVNQAIKAAAIARKFLAQDELEVICIPAFVEVDIGGRERTAIRLIIEPREEHLIEDIQSGRVVFERHQGEEEGSAGLTF